MRRSAVRARATHPRKGPREPAYVGRGLGLPILRFDFPFSLPPSTPPAGALAAKNPPAPARAHGAGSRGGWEPGAQALGGRACPPVRGLGQRPRSERQRKNMAKHSRHAAQPRPITEDSEPLSRASSVCGALVNNNREARITYNRSMVDCKPCLRRMSRFPQLLAALDAARQPALPGFVE